MRSRTCISIVILHLYSLISIPWLDSHAAEADDPYSLNLSELQMVTVASKQAESIWDAPGVVTVITRDEIQRFGANDLYDLLLRLPNVYPFSGNDVRHTTVSARGQFSSTINKHLLILLNGRPMQDPFTAGANGVIYRAFPVSVIERIEMIRGPGSVLYGSGAFAGAINLVTRTPDPLDPKVTSTVTYGSMDTARLDTTVNGVAKDVKFMVNWQLLDSDGIDVFVNGPPPEDFAEQDYSVTANVQWRDLTLNLFTSRGISKTFGLGLPVAIIDEIDRRRLIDLGWRRNLGDEWELKLNLAHSYGELIHEGFADLGNGDGYSAELSLSGNPTDRLNVIVGTTYDNQKGSVTAVAPVDYNLEWKSLYFQGTFDVVDWLSVVGGGQYNSPEGSEFSFSPRVGTILNFNENWSGKILFSEAFRSPSGFETGLEIPGAIVRNPDLVPETVKTLDVQLSRHNARGQASLTYYRSKQEDTIRQAPSPTNPGFFSFQNVDEIDYEGVEFEGKLALGKGWELLGAASYQTNERANVKNVKLVPNWMLKAGISYDNRKGLRLGLFNSYLENPTRVESVSPPGTVTILNNPRAEGYNHLTAQLSLNLNQYFGWTKRPEWEFSVFGDNLLESDVVFVPGLDSTFNTIPNWSERAVYARLTARF